MESMQPCEAASVWDVLVWGAERDQGGCTRPPKSSRVMTNGFSCALSFPGFRL